MFFIRLFLAKFGGHRARLREKENLFRHRGNLLRFVRARDRVRALTTRNLCAVGMRNAILRNCLNEFWEVDYSSLNSIL